MDVLLVWRLDNYYAFPMLWLLLWLFRSRDWSCRCEAESLHTQCADIGLGMLHEIATFILTTDCHMYRGEGIRRDGWAHQSHWWCLREYDGSGKVAWDCDSPPSHEMIHRDEWMNPIKWAARCSSVVRYTLRAGQRSLTGSCDHWMLAILANGKKSSKEPHCRFCLVAYRVPSSWSRGVKESLELFHWLSPVLFFC